MKFVDPKTDIAFKWNFIELKKFHKAEHELETVADKWIYFIKQANDLDHIPENATTQALKLAYTITEQHKWTSDELAIYESQEMEIHRHMKNKIFYSNNLDVLRCYTKDKSVDLCYVALSFNSSLPNVIDVLKKAEQKVIQKELF